MDVDALFERHHPALVRYLTRYTGDPDEAADAAQEAYLRLVERPPERQQNVRAWLFTVATNVVRDNWKKRREVALSLEAAERATVEQPAPDPHAAVEREERRHAVRQILAKLSAKERTILLMREEGFTHREIAEAVGTTPKSIGTMIARALGKLSGYLGDVVEELQ